MTETIELKHCFYCNFNLAYSKIWFFAHDRCFCSEKCRNYFLSRATTGYWANSTVRTTL